MVTRPIETANKSLVRTAVCRRTVQAFAKEKAMVHIEMTHDEFVQSFKAGKLAAEINRDFAIHYLPISGILLPTNLKKLPAVTKFNLLCSGVCYLIGIAFLIWSGWFPGIGFIVVGFILHYSSVIRSACNHVLEKALEDELYYYKVRDAGALRISNVDIG